MAIALFYKTVVEIDNSNNVKGSIDVVFAFVYGAGHLIQPTKI